MSELTHKFSALHDLFDAIPEDGCEFKYDEVKRVRCKFDYVVSSETSKRLIALLASPLKPEILEMEITGEESNFQKSDLAAYLNCYENSNIKFVLRFGVNDFVFISTMDAKIKLVSIDADIEEFYILDSKTYVGTDPIAEWVDFKGSVVSIKTLLLNLASIAHYSSGYEAVYVDPGASVNSSFAICTDLKKIYREVPELIQFEAGKKYELSELISSVKDRKHYQQNEFAILRATVLEFFRACQDKSDPCKISYYFVKNQDQLISLFENNLQAYVKGLSLDKLRAELAECQIKLSEQATKGLMDISGKMFVIPALALIPRLLPNSTNSYDSNWSIVIITITCMILLSALIMQLKQLDIISHSNEIVFRNFDQKIEYLKDEDKNLANNLEAVRGELQRTVRRTKLCLWFYLILAISPIGYFLFMHHVEVFGWLTYLIEGTLSYITSSLIRLYDTLLKL